MLSPAQYNQVVRIYQAFLRDDPLSSAACQIYVGTITGVISGCTINIINQCSSGDTPALLASAVRLTEDLTKNRNINGIFLQSRDSCKALSNLQQSITVSSFDIGTCNAPAGQLLEFNFVNSGSAYSNCLLSNLLISAMPSVKPLDQLASVKPLNNISWKPPTYAFVALGVLVGAGLTLSLREYNSSKLETLFQIGKT